MLRTSKKLSKSGRVLAAVTAAAVLAVSTGCTNTGEPAPSSEPSGRQVADYVGESYVQKPSKLDYSYMWWANGLYDEKGNTSKRQMNIQTGYYGLAVNPATGGIVKLGGIADAPSETEAQQEHNQWIEALPSVSMDYSLDYSGKHYGFAYVDATEGGVNSTRILESGRYMQRLDLFSLAYKGNKEVTGRMEVACMPEYFSLTYEIYASQQINNASLSFQMTIPSGYTHAESLENGRALLVRDEAGNGLTFAIPKGSNAGITLDGTEATFFCDGVNASPNVHAGFSIIVIPRANATAQDAALHTARENVTVTARQVSPQQGKEQAVTQDAQKGYYSISLADMFTKVLDESNTPQLQNTYDQLTFTIENNSDKTIKVPLQFVKTQPVSITGFSPMLRDTNTGEPIGVQVQLTKNWHTFDTSVKAYNDPARNWEGTWFHGYTLIEVPAGQSVSYDYTCPFAQWGGVYTISHSQLCLAGWGGNQQWETSALGSFGEAFCHDIQEAYTGNVLGDICPGLITSRVNNDKYNWTINVGGADFLVYYPPGAKQKMHYGGMKTYFKKQGPNVTEVLYSGPTADGKIQMEYSANMCRTDDNTKVIHTFRYTFLQDVEFDRFAFYQFGADGYNIGVNKTIAVGNDQGLTPFSIGGKQFDGVFAAPVSEKNEYYLSDAMQRIQVGGEGLWFGYLDGEPNPGTLGAGGNKLLSVLDFKGDINGKIYTQPAFNLRTTYMQNTYDSVIELCPPAEAGNVIKAGSVVEGSVAFINLPVQKKDYWGPNATLNAMPAEQYNTWNMMHLFATQSKLQISAQTGTVLNQTIPRIEADAAKETACQFTVKNGIGYVPITITGLNSYSGWQLQKQEGDHFVNVDQSVHGNDYWQAWYDAQTGLYELSFNVPHNGDSSSITYRLVRK